MGRRQKLVPLSGTVFAGSLAKITTSAATEAFCLLTGLKVTLTRHAFWGATKRQFDVPLIKKSVLSFPTIVIPEISSCGLPSTLRMTLTTSTAFGEVAPTTVGP